MNARCYEIFFQTAATVTGILLPFLITGLIIASFVRISDALRDYSFRLSGQWREEDYRRLLREEKERESKKGA